MANSRKKRLQTHHTKDVRSLKKKSVLLSNTSKRLQKVVTSVSTLASHTQEPDGDDDGQAEMMADNGMDVHADANTNVTSCTDFEHPAALHVRTKAKRYQNSVCALCILSPLKLIINNPSLGRPPPHMERTL